MVLVYETGSSLWRVELWGSDGGVVWSRLFWSRVVAEFVARRAMRQMA